MLGANRYSGCEEWLRDWQTARSDEFFALGSRDETASCQLCVADDGSLSLGLGLSDVLAGEHGKYLVIPGGRFRYGQEQGLATLESDAEYAAFRRKHGEKAGRRSVTGSRGTGRAGRCSSPPTWRALP